MRDKAVAVSSWLAALLLAGNLALILLVFPDEQEQGPIFRIIFFHVPMAWTAFVAFFAALVASILYLASKNLRYDAFAAAVTEVGLAFGAANLLTGMIWGRIIWGAFWVWDPRLTSMLVGWLLYAGYVMLRRAIEEPTERARMSAVVSIFAFADVPIIFFSIQWWRTHHPQPVVWGSTGGRMSPEYWFMLFFNWIPILLVGYLLLELRMRQERLSRELDALRREAHAL
jgi:heme exporter protein C